MKYLLLFTVLFASCSKECDCTKSIENYKLSLAIWEGDHLLQPINFDAVDSIYAERQLKFK
jgi:hypothetical protein